MPEKGSVLIGNSEAASLDNRIFACYIVCILKKAWKRTLSGERSREMPPWAASGVCRNRNGYRLGAARRYVGRDGISRYREHERHNDAERTL